ncbi:Propionate kinase [Hartmannibacter diazotrophicus]|uniref:Acetate kinase n=1 Tax=Hartmannibacter diazotrophicus TaxID=1482074 RepID=A0A2C9D3L9_9HYPH|nr:acetate/propionate family kinase [Hartmannibacter diazotrophicus]SON54391.1 Propionate kinase [Hartmannibacter diazotrophicus]
MQGRILVLNAGSTSLKFALLRRDLSRQLSGQLAGIGSEPTLAAKGADGPLPTDGWNADRASDVHGLIAALIGWIEGHLGPGGLIGIGHRVATGGLENAEHCLIDGPELERLKASVPLAPLHQPRNIEPIEALIRLHPHLPQVACFDTAFHRGLPPVASSYGLPRALTAEGARRYGYHGLSYEYVSRRLARLDPRAASGRVVIAHLGGGASLCALKDGVNVGTTMGFSPLSGLMMATRPGELDAGLVLWLLRRGMSADEIEALLYGEAGLKGVSGLTGDMKTLLESGALEARDAVELYLRRLTLELGGLIAVLGGLDTLVFTAGIGEHAAPIRSAVAEAFGWLGLRLGEDTGNGERCISATDSKVSAWVIPTDEELIVARHTARLIAKE